MPLIADRIRQSGNLGKGKLLFREGARTGFDDMLEVDDFKFTKTVEKVEKNTSRDNSGVQIFSLIKSVKVNGSCSCVSPMLDVLRFFTMSKEVTSVAQNSGSLSYAQFTASLGRWIELGKVNLSSVLVRKNAGATFTAEADDDTITSNAHGFADGNPVFVANSGGALPAGLTADTIFYVRDSAANTFKLAATSGGAAIDLTTDGTGTQTVYRAYIKNVDYELLEEPGLLLAVVGGAITEALVIAVKATYATQAMYEVLGVTKTVLEGDMAFYGAGHLKQDFFAKVRLSASGDFSMVGEDAQKFQIDFDVLQSTDANGNTYYYKLRDRSGISIAVAAI